MFRRNKKTIRPYEIDVATTYTGETPLSSPEPPMSPKENVEYDRKIQDLNDRIVMLERQIKHLAGQYKINITGSQQLLLQISEKYARKISQIGEKVISDILKDHQNHIDKYRELQHDIQIKIDHITKKCTEILAIKSELIHRIEEYRIIKEETHIDPTDTTLVTLNFNGQIITMFKRSSYI